MKKRILIRNLAFFLLPTAFLAGAVQASPVVEERGFQDKLSKISTFQTAVLSISNDIGSDGLKRRGDGSIDDSQPGEASHNDDIGSDGLKRRGDGSIDDSQPGQENGDRHQMRGLNRGHGNRDDSMRTDNSGKGRMDRIDRDNRGRGRGRGRHGRIERPERQDRSGRSEKVERPERQDRHERLDRIERPDRKDRAERPERPDKPDSSGRGGRG